VVLLVFFFILPVINGFWDWLSWWVTRLLGRHLLVTLAPARALGGRAVTILGHGLLDFVLSAALLAAMAFLLAFGFEAYDQIAAAQGQRAFDLGPYLEAAADHPWTDGLWLTVMLLSTLFPTALHVVVLLASPLARKGQPCLAPAAPIGDDGFRERRERIGDRPKAQHPIMSRPGVDGRRSVSEVRRQRSRKPGNGAGFARGYHTCVKMRRRAVRRYPAHADTRGVRPIDR
jgi:hypothetical protein